MKEYLRDMYSFLSCSSKYQSVIAYLMKIIRMKIKNVLIVIMAELVADIGLSR
jgi:hypothetical protein